MLIRGKKPVDDLSPKYLMVLWSELQNPEFMILCVVFLFS